MTTTVRSLLAARSEEIVNTKLVVPLSVSSCETSLMEIIAVSSFSIVPRPVPSPITTRVASVAPSNFGSLRLTLKVSSISTSVSPVTATVTVVEVLPAVMVAV